MRPSQTRISHRDGGARCQAEVLQSCGCIVRSYPNEQAQRYHRSKRAIPRAHGFTTDKRTRIRDQERAPIAADLQRSMRASSTRRTHLHINRRRQRSAPTVALHPCDFHHLICQVEAGSETFIKTAGTFGVCMGVRLSQHFVGDECEHMAHGGG